MEIVTSEQSPTLNQSGSGPKTKECPFCAETIQARAIKCRFCGEFLNTDFARAAQAGLEPLANPPGTQRTTAGGVLFRGSPSLWGMAGSLVCGSAFLACAVFLFVYPVEELSWFEFAISEVPAFASYRETAAIVLAALVVLRLLIKIMKLKTIRYEVTADRIEWSRGILSRKVDNLDMFRIIDMYMRRTLFDYIFGVGTITLITTDKTSPNFIFHKVRRPCQLYDTLKKASLEADKRGSVVHVE
jgi:membrane protein YdbS with pleckstrin-like domain